MKIWIIGLSILISGIIFYQTKAPHNAIKNTPLESHKYHIIPKIFTDEEFKHLKKISKEINYTLATRADDKPSVDYSYGSEPLSENGKCNHWLHIPNR